MKKKPLPIMNLISDNGRTRADRLALDLSKVLKQRDHRVAGGCPSGCYLTDVEKAVKKLCLSGEQSSIC